MWAEAMLNGIILRRIRRVMSASDFEPQAVRDPLQVLLEQLLTGTVTSSPIAEQ